MLQKFSFRQLLVIAFLLIAALLGTASLRALFTLEELTLQSRDGAARSLELGQLAQSLSELSVSMERTSRQSVVLDDRVLRARVAEQAREASTLLASLSTAGLSHQRAQQWRAHVQTVNELLAGPPETALERERELAQSFRELAGVNAAVAVQVQKIIQQRNQALEAKLEDSRSRLAQQVNGLAFQLTRFKRRGVEAQQIFNLALQHIGVVAQDLGDFALLPVEFTGHTVFQQ